MSKSGSGLPYANPLQAYENTPNKGVVPLVNNKFEFKMYYPNAYYSKLGSEYISPQITFKICRDGYKKQDVHIIKIDNGIPFRMLTVPKASQTNPRKNALFYKGKDELPVRSQEEILRSSGFPVKNITPPNFWGLKPPQ